MGLGFLIRNGSIVDGTGQAAYQADLRVRDGIIAEIGEKLDPAPDERVVDASGCYVAPGFIEGHNHYDGPMWWMPTMDPMPGYGVTTSINGNCGFSAAPVHDDPRVREEMVNIFSFFEDIPKKPFLELLPWDWRSWSEYKDSLQRHVKLPVNYAAFVGHIAMRLAVMGMDAWDRVATPAEIDQMCALLEDALQAGAIGLSSNLLDHDAHDRPVPTWKADAAEWTALIGVLEKHDSALLQVIVDYTQRMNAPASMEMIAGLVRGRKVRVQFADGIPTLEALSSHIPEAMGIFERLRNEGLDVWIGHNHRGITVVLNFNTSLIFAQSNNYAWNEIVEAQGQDAKFALLRDPEWRARGRESWSQIFDQSPLKRPEELELFESENGFGPIGVTLKDYMDRTGAAHPSDALAEWVLRNGPASIVRLASLPNDEPANIRLMKTPNVVGNLSDSGAHGQMFCGVGGNVDFLSEYVRDNPVFTIEQAIWFLTGRPADHFNLHDRGRIAIGRKADIAIFDLAEIQFRKEEKRWDVPDGEGGCTYRYGRAAAPMRMTMVNGVPTFDNGDFTGKFPGEYIGPVKAAEESAA